MRILLSFALLVAITGGLVIANGSKPSADRRTNKEIMKGANAGEGSLFGKVVSGKASDEEKMKLVDFYIDLVENDAAKGDKTEWKMAAGTLMLAAAKVAVGRDGAAEELKEAGNCKACHDKFKGK